MKANDAITGAIFLLIAILAFAYAGTFPTMPGVTFGPDLFPRLVAVMMGAGGAILIVKGILARRAGQPLFRLDHWARRPRSYVIFFAVVGGVLFYVFAAGWLGFLLTASLMLAALLLLTRGPRHVVSSLVIALLVTGAIHLLFADVLRVPLPFGIVEAWLAS